MDNKIFKSRYEPGEGESKFEIVFDEDGARVRTTEMTLSSIVNLMSKARKYLTRRTKKNDLSQGFYIY